MEDLRNITPEEYTDKDMQVVTQLAYIDFKKELYGMTIGEILIMRITIMKSISNIWKK